MVSLTLPDYLQSSTRTEYHHHQKVLFLPPLLRENVPRNKAPETNGWCRRGALCLLWSRHEVESEERAAGQDHRPHRGSGHRKDVGAAAGVLQGAARTLPHWCRRAARGTEQTKNTHTHTMHELCSTIYKELFTAVKGTRPKQTNQNGWNSLHT